MKTSSLTTYSSEVSLGTTANGTSIDCGQYPHISFIATVSASFSPVGVLSIQASNDNLTWVDTTKTASITGNGTTFLSDTFIPYRYARLTYTRTSGTATLNASFFGRGGGD